MQKQTSFAWDFCVGGVTGCIGKTIFAPIERVKLLLQTQDANYKLAGHKYEGVRDCVVRVFREEGFRAFWKGNFPNILLYFPTAAFNFAFKDKFNRLLKIQRFKDQPRTFFWMSLLSGGCAGAACNFILFPLKLARLCIGVDVQTQAPKGYSSLMQFYRNSYQQKGIRGWYSGLANSLVSVFIFRGVHFGLFDTGKVVLPNYDKASPLQKLLFAQLVSIFAETLTYPSDTLKRRMMMNGFQKENVYNNSWQCFLNILSNEGVRGFYKGNLSNLMKSGCNAIILVLYDAIQEGFDKKK